MPHEIFDLIISPFGSDSILKEKKSATRGRRGNPFEYAPGILYSGGYLLDASTPMVPLVDSIVQSVSQRPHFSDSGSGLSPTLDVTHKRHSV